ncbi:MAG: hypothetical protein AB8C13_05615 [Phycisphaerales bacterium]
MGTTIHIKAPADYDLARDVCSYGYFLLAPNHWDVDHKRILRVLDLPDGPSLAIIDQQPDSRIRARFDRMLSRSEQSSARSQITRMLSLETSHASIKQFHKCDPRWKKSGRGRLFRSPTLFEDVIKTVTSCNVTWPSTVNMNRRLCEVCGTKSPSGVPSFPSAKKLARTRLGTLRGRCRVGYRDQRIIDLAKIFRKGDIDESWLEHTGTDEEVFKFLITLPGIGPYAAGNIMQLMGRYSKLALDTESIRHAKAVLKMEGTDAQLMKALTAHYNRFGEHKFRSYWFEVWCFYESKAGPATTWRRDATASMFTAANLKK